MFLRQLDLTIDMAAFMEAASHPGPPPPDDPVPLVAAAAAPPLLAVHVGAPRQLARLVLAARPRHAALAPALGEECGQGLVVHHNGHGVAHLVTTGQHWAAQGALALTW